MSVTRLNLVDAEPSLNFTGDKLRIIIAANMLWNFVLPRRLSECR